MGWGGESPDVALYTHSLPACQPLSPDHELLKEGKEQFLTHDCAPHVQYSGMQ